MTRAPDSCASVDPFEESYTFEERYSGHMKLIDYYSALGEKCKSSTSTHSFILSWFTISLNGYTIDRHPARVL